MGAALRMLTSLDDNVRRARLLQLGQWYNFLGNIEIRGEETTLVTGV